MWEEHSELSWRRCFCQQVFDDSAERVPMEAAGPLVDLVRDGFIILNDHRIMICFCSPPSTSVLQSILNFFFHSQMYSVN